MSNEGSNLQRHLRKYTKGLQDCLSERQEDLSTSSLPLLVEGFSRHANTILSSCPPPWLLCPMSKSPSGKREDLHDNATRKGREIYCWLKSGPLLQPTQWCKVRKPWAPVSTHIYRVLDFKHKQWVVSASGLVTCLRSNFIGQTHFKL